MNAQEAIRSFDESARVLLAVARALAVGDIEDAKALKAQALRLLDDTCAIQLDTLT